MHVASTLKAKKHEKCKNGNIWAVNKKKKLNSALSKYETRIDILSIRH